LIILLISIIAIGLTALLYYRNIHLAPLRIIAIVIFYLLISGASLSFKIPMKTQKPLLLVDCSASMSDNFPLILQEIKKIDFPHRVLFFSETLYTSIPVESIPSGSYTDITGALLKVSKEAPFIILVSDGNHNYHRPDWNKIGKSSTPVYCFGIGGTPGKDLAIVDLLYPEYGFAGDSFNVKVIVQSQGFKNGRGKIKLRSKNKKIKSNRSFPLTEEPTKNEVDFKIYTPYPETLFFSINLLPQAGEETYKNNNLSFSIQILKGKIDVLYYTEHLSFNTRFIFRALSADPYTNLIPLVKVAPQKYINLNGYKEQGALPPLNKFDVLVLDNVNSDSLPWQNLGEEVKQGLGLLHIGLTEGRNPFLRNLLPISTTGFPIKIQEKIVIKEPFSCLIPGDDYPPFSYINRVIGTKKESVILAEAGRIPIIGYLRLDRGIIFQINGVEIGSWQFLQTGLKQKDLLTPLLGDIIRFISTAGRNRRLILSSLRKNYSIGETIELSLQSYDRNFKPCGGGEFYVDLFGKKIPFFETRPGIYKASFPAPQKGTYRLTASGNLGDEILTSNELILKIKQGDLESEHSLNKEFLKTLASKTGGRYSPFDSLERFSMPVVQKSYQEKSFNFNTPLSYFLIFILLTADWFLRRKRGII